MVLTGACPNTITRLAAMRNAWIAKHSPQLYVAPEPGWILSGTHTGTIRESHYAMTPAQSEGKPLPLPLPAAMR